MWVALAGLVVVATAVPLYRHRQPLRAKWAQFAFERQCLNYRAPADLVVYTEDPGEFAALLAARQPAGGRYRQTSDDSFVNFYRDVWVANPLLKWDPGPAFFHRRENSRGETAKRRRSAGDLLL